MLEVPSIAWKRLVQMCLALQVHHAGIKPLPQLNIPVFWSVLLQIWINLEIFTLPQTTDLLSAIKPLCEIHQPQIMPGQRELQSEHSHMNPNEI